MRRTASEGQPEADKKENKLILVSEWVWQMAIVDELTLNLR